MMPYYSSIHEIHDRQKVCEIETEAGRMALVQMVKLRFVFSTKL
ncbi:hypothetical protein [Clostridium sp. Marseille-P2415]|nr:hypothetical protein [Clostridium sp. Marseille-P2415]